VLRIAVTAAGFLATAGIAYYALCLWSAFDFFRETWQTRIALPSFVPPVSILKPLRGADPGMYEAFRSHCLQDYPVYELIFGVAEAGDPAAALVERLKSEFPERRIELLVCPLFLGTNGKVSSLVQMLPHARHRYLVINDSDIRVPADYLRRVISPLADPQIGLVTAPYRGAAAETLPSKLEALSISTDFFPSVLAARVLEGGIRFALGSTLAFSRDALETIGGFEPLLDYLADDYELGARIAAAGFKVELSETVVDTHLPAYTFREYCKHQLRWARTIREARKWGYAGLAVTFVLPWALLAVALARGAGWSWTLLGSAIVLRLGSALTAGKWILQDPQLPRDLWLVPLRDALALLLWVASFIGRTVSWRGDRFRLQQGKLTRLR
jgi:ceramide glucosyltransferase